MYIETFCQHLAALFAKLSNIRMSYEVYGFKHPHQEWEGVLALDIWYQALYNEIDGKYPFNESFIDRNPFQQDFHLLIRIQVESQYRTNMDMSLCGTMACLASSVALRIRWLN